MSSEEITQETRVVCPVCEKDFQPIASGKIRIHKIRGVRCDGSEGDPQAPGSSEPASAGPQCRVCKAPAVLTPNGRVRSHLDRTNQQNPCDGGSDWPLGAYPDIEVPTRGDVATAGDSSWQETEKLWQGGSPHVHSFEYGDDGKGHSGDVCTQCGMPLEDLTPEAAGGMGLHPRTGFPLHKMTGRGTVSARPASAGDDFLDGTPRRAPAASGSADDFLDDTGSGDEEEENQPGRWFNARYDGSCGTCGRDFAEGDRIRRAADGDWEAEDCCGDEIESDREARTEQAKAVAAKPQLPDLQLPVRNGRYVGPDPETGKSTKYTRTTTFAETLADSIALDQWKGRMTVMGLALRPDLLAKTRSVVQGAVPYEVAKEQRVFLNGIVEDAKLAAGSKDRARKGTILHKHTQEIDSGRRTLAEVPEEFRRDVAVYLAAMERAGFRLLPHLIERSVLSTELGVVGTFDRVVEVLWDQKAVSLNGRPVQLHKGDHVIGDVKSGASLEFPWLEIEIQLSIYAHAVNENGVAVPDGPSGRKTWRWAPLAEFGAPRVREDVGVVMHIPYGAGHCELHYADLIEGWRGAQLCKVVRDWRKLKFPAAPFYSVVADDVAVPEDAPAAAPEDVQEPAAQWPTPEPSRNGTPKEAGVAFKRGPDWDGRFRVVKTKDEALALWREAKASGVSADRLSELIEIGRQVLRTPVSEPPAPPADEPASPPPAAPQPSAEPSWEERFRAVTNRDEALALWREAKAAGVLKEALENLVAVGRDAIAAASAPPPEPTWEEKAEKVTTRAEASEIFRAMREQAGTLGTARIKAVTARMQEVLAG